MQNVINDFQLRIENQKKTRKKSSTSLISVFQVVYIQQIYEEEKYSFIVTWFCINIALTIISFIFSQYSWVSKFLTPMALVTIIYENGVVLCVKIKVNLRELFSPHLNFWVLGGLLSPHSMHLISNTLYDFAKKWDTLNSKLHQVDFIFF